MSAVAASAALAEAGFVVTAAISSCCRRRQGKAAGGWPGVIGGVVSSRAAGGLPMAFTVMLGLPRCYPATHPIHPHAPGIPTTLPCGSLKHYSPGWCTTTCSSWSTVLMHLSLSLRHSLENSHVKMVISLFLSFSRPTETFLLQSQELSDN